MGEGGFEVENGEWSQTERGGKKTGTYVERERERKYISCFRRISGGCWPRYWIEREDNLGPVL